MSNSTPIKSVLVTGASGFIGGAIVDQLARDGRYHITATGRSKMEKWENTPGVEYVPMDLAESLPQLSFDICVHCAGLADDKSTEEELYRANVWATKNVLRALRGCQTFILISSGSVYQFGSDFPLKENDLPEVAPSLYGRSKREAEKILEGVEMNRRISLRPRAVYGPGDQTLWPRFLARIRNGNIIMPGPLSDAVSMTHVNNLVYAVKLCIEKGQSGYSVYNVGDAHVYQLRDVFQNVLRMVYPGEKGHEVKTIPSGILRMVVRVMKFFKIPFALSEQAIDYVTQRAVIDITAIQQDLGYTGEVENKNRPDVGDFMG